MTTRKPARSRWLGGDDSEARPGTVLASSTPTTRRTDNWLTADASSGPLDDHYQDVSKNWKTTQADTFAELVVPTGNAAAPIHRWFHFKEAYSHRLLPEVLSRLGIDNEDTLHVIDPFSGVGTTLLSAIELTAHGSLSEVHVDGLEVNPFLRDLAAAKIEVACNTIAVSANDLLAFLESAARITVAPGDLPDLSTFGNPRYFEPSFVEDIVALRLAIDSAEDGPTKRLARIALSMTVEPASRLRRDGRALRFEDRQPVPPRKVYARAVRRLVDDLAAAQSWRTKAVAEVRLGSASEAWPWSVAESADLVMFSPPYPNNIDYTEVYKTELWALGYVDDAAGFREQRHRTLRSHPSVRFERALAFEASDRAARVGELIAPVLAEIPADSRYAKQLERLVSGYADDMLAVLDSSFKALKPGGSLVYVVGNSVHGTTEDPVLIASDVILARLGEIVGFEVMELCAARPLPRRRVNSSFVRESVVFLSKPNR